MAEEYNPSYSSKYSGPMTWLAIWNERHKRQVTRLIVQHDTYRVSRSADLFNSICDILKQLFILLGQHSYWNGMPLLGIHSEEIRTTNLEMQRTRTPKTSPQLWKYPHLQGNCTYWNIPLSIISIIGGVSIIATCGLDERGAWLAHFPAFWGLTTPGDLHLPKKLDRHPFPAV